MKVRKTKCDQCLFSNNRIVSAKRATDVIKSCIKKDTFFVCHKTQTEDAPDQMCCRGFWDQFKNHFNLGRIAQRLKMVEFIE